MSKRNENVEWKRFDSKKFHSLYRSPDIVKVINSMKLRWAGHVAKMEEDRSAFNISTGKPIGMRPLGRPGRRWVECSGVDIK